MRTLVPFLLAVLCTSPCFAQWERAVDQIPDLKSLPDMTSTLQEQLDRNGGSLLLTAKIYRITGTLEFDLKTLGAAAVKSAGGSTIIMDGAGPAIRFTGTHEGTASPASFKPATWNERMPIVTGIEILGAHPEADGIELRQTVAPIVNRISVRWCRHGIHLVNRNRNVVISDCHLYENSGVGVFLDDVNLHQINVSNSHISYNRAGGIVVRDAEIAITGCTIQHSANYSGSEAKTQAPGGANIRLAGKEIYPINSVTISGNVISDTTTNVDINYAHDVTIGSNTFFAPKPNNLLVANSQRVVVSGNTFNPRQFTRPGTIRFTDCADCVLANSTIHKFATDAGAVILDRCTGFMLTGLVLSDCDSGIILEGTSETTIANCRVSRTAEGGADIAIDKSNQNIQLSGNSFSGSTAIHSSSVEVYRKAN